MKSDSIWHRAAPVITCILMLAPWTAVSSAILTNESTVDFSLFVAFDRDNTGTTGNSFTFDGTPLATAGGEGGGGFVETNLGFGDALGSLLGSPLPYNDPTSRFTISVEVPVGVFRDTREDPFEGGLPETWNIGFENIGGSDERTFFDVSLLFKDDDAAVEIWKGLKKLEGIAGPLFVEDEGLVAPDDGNAPEHVSIQAILGSESTKTFELSFALAEPDDGNGTTVPEPGTMALLGVGLAGAGLLRRRRRTV